MRTFLPRGILCLILTLGFLFVSPLAQAQKLQRTHNQNPQKGHALYKQSKIYDSKTGPVGVKPKRVGDRAMDRWLHELEQTRDPQTQEIPVGIRELSANFSNKITERDASGDATAKTGAETDKRSGYSYWKNRGPGNVGGRTRALALDRNNENIIFAGGVSGGLWRSTDKGESWKKVTKSYQSPSITAIIQDPRPGKHRIWYYASGERFGNSASAGGAFYTGSGIYKSYNNGRSWYRLRNSNDNDVTSFSALDLINSIAIHPHNGDLYAATFNGVQRSTDGGRNFEEVLASGFDVTTEVMITPEGVIYATVEANTDGTQGFYTSTDGENWTEISPDIPFVYGRTVMAYDPSNTNRVYFFAQNLVDAAFPFLLRYDADVEEDAQWTDLSANLPVNIGGLAGNLNLQGDYNMLVRVSPHNPDLVFVGGTNLYRSTDGFTSPVGREGWVGGYTATANSYALYDNHHPDQHNMVFSPTNPEVAISSNDGGVQITANLSDTTAVASVQWTSLNNKYVTTQPYAFSFDPSGKSDDLLAGFQDNGTWFTDSRSINKDWIEDFGGDGSYNAISDEGRTRYVSSQFGNLYRLNFDENGEFASFTKVTPAGASGFRFVAPFLLDPNNDNIMYMPAGNTMWRNNDLDAIPLFSTANASEGWVNMSQSAVPEGSITAMDVSKYPIANTLYYGTSAGAIFKMKNANIDDQEAVDISTGKGLPEGGFINNIYVDPTNDQRVFAVFSNYNIPSIFMSKNGGETWVDISGNLEENKDGTGNGPSVRWIAMNGNNDGYWAGTSTGLYFAWRLKGKKTRWYREPFKIGNAVVAQVKTRSDGFVAAAIHGNGLYSANFWVRERPEPRLSVERLLTDVLLPMNSDPVTVDISGVFAHSKGKPIDIKLTNSNPDLIMVSQNGDELTLTISPEMEGSAAIGLIATSGKEQVSEGFTVNVVEPAIYQQLNPEVGSSPSQDILDFGLSILSADDFIVPNGSSWTIDRIAAFGEGSNNPVFTSVNIEIYADNGGKPGNLVHEIIDITPSSEPNSANLMLEFPEFDLNSGSYWISVYTNLAFNPGGRQWFWKNQENVVGQEVSFKDEGNIFGVGATDWTPLSVAFGDAPVDCMFQIFGTVHGEAEEEEGGRTEVAMETPQSGVAQDPISPDVDNLVSISPKLTTSVWPNPSTSVFNFSVQQVERTQLTAKVYSLGGQIVYRNDKVSSAESFSWNAAGVPAGIYLVKISGQGVDRIFKIVKK